MGNMRPPVVSVIIPTMRQRHLRRCLLELNKQTTRAFEVIVVENGARSNTTISLVRDFSQSLDIHYEYDPRPGGNRARNRGAQLARGEIFAFLDDDCFPDPDWVEVLERDFELRQKPTVIGGKVVLQYASTPPGWFTGVFTRSLSAIDLGAVRRSLYEWEYVVSANLATARRTFEDLGGFDPDIGIRGRDTIQLGNDEIEFLQRCASNGVDLIYEPGMRVTHTIPQQRVSLERIALRRYGQGVSDVALALSGQQGADLDVFEQQWAAKELCARKNGRAWLTDMTAQRRAIMHEDAIQYDRNSRVVRLSYLCGLLHGVEHLLFVTPGEVPLSGGKFATQQYESDQFWLQRLLAMDVVNQDRWLMNWARSEARLALTGEGLANA